MTDTRPSIYQHPLAYLVGLQGVALMRAFAGEHDRAFVEARLADVRALLDAADRFGPGRDVPPIDTRVGYRHWAPRYDGPNGFWGTEEPLVRPLMEGLPRGVAVDAACGTGRHTAWLVGQGHEVLAFDTSPDMLEIARAKVPGAHFAEADLRDLPLADASADLVLVTLALSHVRDLGPVFAELARVLRPGGHLVVSDTRGFYVGSPLYPLVEGADGTFGYIPNWYHATSEYLQAALPVGLAPRFCREYAGGGADDVDEGREFTARADGGAGGFDPDAPTEVADRTRPPDVWEMMTWVEAAAGAAYAESPVLIVWDFERV
ncbi:class I SAM-dependent methyltransferase [Isoptericola sp. NEAU-Y5]|uniref:Class I SAM-dependent methyltransferase n=1 Tax=Isoptericola luteus TaxID=2879484 RepID=A0ABS7ZC34_9MICO|nr:class I SAM-dependent methyltransferase [Isoptericola sp. NEAU-Y5]MCA5892615.1 class I SAM-dependent methyltransferase [Isoptericola sp. NEAU-Y5]